MAEVVGVYRLECGHVVEALEGDDVDAVPCPWCGESRKSLGIAWAPNPKPAVDE